MNEAEEQLIEHRRIVGEPPSLQCAPEGVELALRERIKELNCLYRLSEIVENCGHSLDTLFQGVAEILPESWLYPETAGARIVFDGKEHPTSNFKDSLWKLAGDILIAGEKAGVVEVHYLQERPTLDEGPFLREERSLINAVAERLGKAIEYIQAQQQVLAEQSALQQKNIALQEVLDAVQEEKDKVGRAVLANVDRIIMPMLDTLEQGLPDRQKKCVAMLKQNLKEIASPFVEKLSKEFHSLTPMEIQICHHIKRGLSSKEMASIESISPATVRTYRFQIRRKLDLLNKDVNLASFLQQMMPKSPNE